MAESAKRSSRVPPLVVAVLLLALVAYIVVTAWGFTAEARRAPQVVGVTVQLLHDLQVKPEEVGKVPETGQTSSADSAPTTAETSEGVTVESESAATEKRDSSPPVSTISEDLQSEDALIKDGSVDGAAISAPAAFGWVGLLAASFLLLGMVYMIPIFVIAFAWLYGRERWRIIIPLAIGTFAVVQLFFVQLLEVQLYGGWLPELLGL
jgi:hypothetical protein